VTPEIGDTVGEMRPRSSGSHHGGAGNFAQLWRDGVKASQVEITSDDFTHMFVDETSGAHRYRIELITDVNQRIVITSHIYATGGPRRLRLRGERSARDGVHPLFGRARRVGGLIARRAARSPAR